MNVQIVTINFCIIQEILYDKISQHYYFFCCIFLLIFTVSVYHTHYGQFSVVIEVQDKPSV